MSNKKTRSLKAKAAPHRLWGGRFAAGPASIMAAINASIDVDKRLYKEDIAGSRAHCSMLVKQGIVSRGDGHKILKGLDRIEREIERGVFAFVERLEDIHMHVEARLHELIGGAAGRLHTARSRNDQVATDLRLWLRTRLDALDGELGALQRALLDQAERHAATPMPGFTHLQVAQPVTFGHHLLAYVEMLGRDRDRAADCRRRLNESPLGAAALAGTSYPIDRANTARALGFDRPMANSIDAVSDRDFALEFLSVGAIIGVHLSRLAEEIVLWTSPGFGFVTLTDAFTTGSSIMPQKRNPDAAELVRAKSGRLFANLQSLLVTLKGLPLAYGKDMQEDKAAVFDAADTLGLALAASAGMVADMKANPAAMRRMAERDYATATDLADWLVQTLGLPFRRAHETTGRIVRHADAKGVALDQLELAELRSIEPRIDKRVFVALAIERSLASRTSLGGTAPARVAVAVRAARRRYR